MKTFFSAWAVLSLAGLVCVSCETLDPTGFFFLRENREGTNTDAEQILESKTFSDNFILDTSVFLCVVQVADDCDWRNDSAYYSQNGTVCFYRNFEKVFEMKTGTDAKVSYSADKHHIIGEDLYSEFADRRGTSIRKNGKLLLSYPENEILKGLLPFGNDIYTLGQNPLTGVVYYRKNGDVIRSLEGGYVTGDFFNPGYGETGALYQDDTCVCFGFVSEEQQTCKGYLFRNGEAAYMCSGKKVLDLRSIEGEGKYVLYGGMSTDVFSGWREASFYLKGRDVFTAGVDMNGNAAVLSAKRIIAMSSGDNQTAYSYDKGWIFISDRYVRSIGDYFLTNGACVCRGVGTIWLALTSHQSSLKPAVWVDGNIRELDINGFFSGIKVRISRTIAKAGTDPPER